MTTVFEKRLEYTKGSSNKFYLVRVNHKRFGGRAYKYVVVLEWGRIGTSGQLKTYDFDGNADGMTKAVQYAKKKIRSKISKGYELVGTSIDSTSNTPPKPPQTASPKTHTVTAADPEEDWGILL